MATKWMYVCALSVTFVVRPMLAQHKVGPRNSYERIYCILPLVGAGTTDDPQRPKYAPVSHLQDSTSRKGILAYTWRRSDDGKFALVEFVAQDKAAFKEILTDTDANVKVFVKGQNSRAEIEGELKKLRKNFSLDDFEVAVP